MNFHGGVHDLTGDVIDVLHAAILGFPGPLNKFVPARYKKALLNLSSKGKSHVQPQRSESS
jgi:hypothetical protein